MSEGRTDLLPGGRFAGEIASVQALPQIRLVETTYGAGQVLRRHAHEHAHLCLVLDGSYTETVHSVQAPRGPLCLVFLPEGCPHGEAHHTSGRHFIVELEAPLVGLFGGTEPPREPTVLSGAAALHAARLYAYTRSEGSLGMVASDLVWQLLAMCTPAPRAHRAAWLRRTRESIRDRYTVTLSLQLLAAEAGVHPVHLAQTFRRIYGCTVGEFVRQLRVQHACRSLIADGLALSEIAQEAGFADQSHFTRCFRRLMGVTPGQYSRLVSLHRRPKGVQDVT